MNRVFLNELSKTWTKLFRLNLTEDEVNDFNISNLFDPFRLLETQVEQDLLKLLDPFGVTRSYLDVQRAWLAHPQELYTRLGRLSCDMWAVQLQSWQRFSGLPTHDVISHSDSDPDFQDPAWTENPCLDVIKEYYLLYSHWLENTIFETPDISPKTKRKVLFWVKQGLNAISPTNFFWTNPTAINRFMATGGKNLLQALKNVLTDMQQQTIRMVDETAFQVGKNLANTKGYVVYRNHLFELIQYTPTTEQVHQIPLLIVPPWINKYYILDLTPQKSMIKYLVDQGYSVFLISWKNPTTEMRYTSVDDYMLKGILEAIQITKAIANAPQVNVVGYCIGGIILTALVAWLANEEDNPIASWSLFATLVDFANPGEIDTFIDENTISYIEMLMTDKGYLDGKQLADSFRMLRSNTLIWHYFVHNYLYGEELPQFDVLFWNMDSTRLPEAMHSFYLRQFYLQNKFVQPDGVKLGGKWLDIRKIKTPLYAVGTEQDHIAPWRETFKICSLINAPVRYTLASSGHILGVISPPVEPPKRYYYSGEAQGEMNPTHWQQQIEKVNGSWWTDWIHWLEQRSGELQPALTVGNVQYPPLIEAPGSYVLEK